MAASNTTRVYCNVSRCSRWANINENGLCPRHVAQIAKDKGEVVYKCLECDTACEKDQPAVLCDRCDTWVHTACIDMSDDIYNMLFKHGSKVPGMRYFCKKCEDRVTEALERYSLLENDTVTLKKEMSDVKKQLADIQKDIKTTVGDTINNVIDDRREIDKRKMNLIVFGLPEADIDTPDNDKTSWDTEDKVDKDIETITDIIINELGVGLSNRNGIINARRLGAKSNKKSRPLKIEFKDLNAKRDVLTKAKNLRKSTNDVAKRLYINPDLTEEQRKRDKDLRAEMWRLRTDEQKNVIIKRGEIVVADHPVRMTRKPTTDM